MSNKYINPVSGVVKSYQLLIPNPAAQAILLAGAGIPLAYLAKRPIANVAKRLAMDPRVSAMLGMKSDLILYGILLMLNNVVGKHAVPLTLGAAPAVIATALSGHKKAPYFNLHTWLPMKKLAFLTKIASIWLTSNFQPDLNFGQLINRLSTMDMINNNPFMQGSPYLKNLGVSIVAGANNQGNLTSLGSVYDSAVNKFDTKLLFLGIGSKALKSTASGVLAGMFTDVIGSVMGMPMPLRNQVSNSVGFGKALYLILN